MTADGARELSSAHADILASMQVDAVTVEVFAALHAVGVQPVLLKGATISRWLYDRSERRSHGDTDLLIRPNDLARSEALLTTLGFEPERDRSWVEGWPEPPARPWVRSGDHALLDVHRNLAGVEVGDDALWVALADELEPMELAGVEVTVLSPAARACHLALHVAQHEAKVDQPVADLERALERLDRATWVRAADLAKQLGAVSAFTLGLASVPAGEQLAHELDLPTRQQAARSRHANSLQGSLQALAETHGAGAKASMVLRKVVPSRRFMRSWSPVARRGPLGLALAYAWRPLWLLARAVGGARGRSSR